MSRSASRSLLRSARLGGRAAVTLAAALAVVSTASAGSASSSAGAAGAAVASANVTTRDLVADTTVEGIVRARAGVTVRRGYTVAVATSAGSGAGQGGAAAGTLSDTALAMAVPTSLAGASTGSNPTASPAPTSGVTAAPTSVSTTAPATTPTGSPTTGPSEAPTSAPTGSTQPNPPPSDVPTGQPTGQPTDQPTSAPTGQPTGGAPTGGAPTGGNPAGGPPTAGQPGAGADGPTGANAVTVTSVASRGTAVATGTVLYAAAGQPVIAVVTDQVFYQDLNTDSTDGPDIAVLEQALTDLGYGADLSVDETFTAATGHAVKQWESDLGRESPDRTVAVGDLVGVPAGGAVIRQHAEPGDSVGDGSDILDIARSDAEIVLDIGADETAAWAVGSTVSIDWPDRTTRTGTVTAVGTDVAGDGTVEVVVTPEDGSDGLVVGAAAKVTATVETRREVLTVPVSALLAGPAGAPAVRLVGAAGDDADTVDTVTVTYGLVVDGLVEITSGLTDGEIVELPGAA